ncbi:MAG: FIST C-terminal domain-containing protein [Deltaproteobacteria bacterium]|jgi:hypothetical protein|nr:FIST C-terminal domain-containing protein [Deltaproteobacteria bacterium]MBW2532747.1 FIST C-terminal domain-containing protein [Deltaproteobacteria bacterium]
MRPFVRAAATTETEPPRIAAALRDQIGSDPAALICFFAGSSLPFPELAQHVHEAFEGARTVGCTTCGELGPSSCTVGAVSALALSPPCRAGVVLVPDLSEFRFDAGEKALASLARQLGTTVAAIVERAREHAFVTLTDGLSGQEEILIAALATYAPGVPLVGGSAADDFRFVETQVAVDGKTAKSGAAIVLLAPGVPFRPFHLHHYETTADSVVVTDAEPERRIIHRIDGRPAIETLTRLMGIDEERLRADPPSELRNQPTVFGIRAADDVFLRSVMDVRGDALLMGGAVEEGTVLWPMTPGNIVEVTSSGIAEAIGDLTKPAGMLLFNCGGRMWEATSASIVEELGAAMLPVPAAGFTTYGEQYGPLQVNHTLTGIAFGEPDAD